MQSAPPIAGDAIVTCVRPPDFQYSLKLDLLQTKCVVITLLIGKMHNMQRQIMID